MASRRARRKSDDAGCGGCALASTPGRREFLRSAGLAVAGLVAAGATPARALALGASSPTETRPTRQAEDTASYPIPTADCARIDREREVILVRYSGAVYAFALSCPHQNTALRWLESEGRFQCPKHKSKYRPDGAFISGRATRSMDRHPVRREGDQVVVSLAVTWREDRNAQEWAAAVVHL